MDRSAAKYLSSFAAFAPVVLWTAIILHLSTTSGLPRPIDTEVAEWVWFKSGHLVFYALQALWLWIAWLQVAKWPFALVNKYPAVISLVMSSVLALSILDEWTQSMTPGRTPRLIDLVVNVLAGAFTCFLLYNRATRRDVAQMA